MTLDDLYNKSHEGFMLSLCQENASIGLKSYLELYRVTALTKVKDWLLLQMWGLTLKESCSFANIEQTLFKGQDLVWFLSKSNWALKTQFSADLLPPDFWLSPGKWQQQVSFFVTFYYPNSYVKSIRFLNMSWSTLLDESNGSSIIKFGVHLDI